LIVKDVESKVVDIVELNLIILSHAKVSPLSLPSASLRPLHIADFAMNNVYI